MSHSQIITPAKRLFTQLFTDDDFDMSEADDQNDASSASEPQDCALCYGTGEGQFDGQSCGACRGRGY